MALQVHQRRRPEAAAPLSRKVSQRQTLPPQSPSSGTGGLSEEQLEPGVAFGQGSLATCTF